MHSMEEKEFFEPSFMEIRWIVVVWQQFERIHFDLSN